MKQVQFSPGKVGSLPPYLSYLFLRFSGTLGPEILYTFECFDTYDRRWSRQGRIWVKRESGLELVEPPSLVPRGEKSSAFGLQKPVLVGTASLRTRAVQFHLGPDLTVEGEVIRSAAGVFLVLSGEESLGFSALESALVADGLVPIPRDRGWWVKDKGPMFEGPQSLPLPAVTGKASEFLLERIRDGLRVTRQYEAGVIKDIDTECLHQYRVYLRRVRSLIGLGKFWEGVEDWGRAKEALRELQQRTNELRDLDVLLLDLPRLRQSLPWGEGEKLEGWEASLVERRQKEWKAVKQWLGSADHAALQTDLDTAFGRLVHQGAPWTVQDLTRTALERSARGLRQIVKSLRDESPDGDYHEARIRTKKLRYVLDALGGFCPEGPLQVVATELKRSQEGLGQFQDRSILIERLKGELETLRAQGGNLDPYAFGILVGTLAADHSRQRALAIRDAHRLKSKAFSKALKQLMGPEVGDGT